MQQVQQVLAALKEAVAGVVNPGREGRGKGEGTRRVDDFDLSSVMCKDACGESTFGRMSTMLVALLLGTTTTSSRGHTAPQLLHHPLQAIRRRRQRHTHCSGNCRSRGRLQPHSTATNVRVQPVTKGSRGGWSTDGTRSTHPHTNDVCRRVRDSTRDAAANKTSKTNRTAWPVLGRSQGRAGHAHDTFTHM